MPDMRASLPFKKKKEKKLCLQMSKIPNAGRGLHCAKVRFFPRSKLAIAQILKLIYLWSHEMATVKNVRRGCGINSAHTLTDWSSCILSAYSDSFCYRPGNARESLALCISTISPYDCVRSG